MKIVILYSGGLDSFILKKYAEKTYPDAEVKCLYYKHGADSEDKEIERLPDFVEVRNLDWLSQKIRPVVKKDDPFAGAIYIPGRNLVFAVLAASQELADEIWMGTVWDEDNPQGTDKNELFRSSTSSLISYVLSPFIDKVALRFPFVENLWTKAKCVEWAINNGVEVKDIVQTVSCWHQKEHRPCGQCKQCFKRYFVFFLNGFTEDYVVSPVFSRYGQDLIQQYLHSYYHDKPNRDEMNVIDMIYHSANLGRFPKPIKDYINHHYPDFMGDYEYYENEYNA